MSLPPASGYLPQTLAPKWKQGGYASDRFTFEGFLAAKSAARRAQLEELRAEVRTMVFYEAPHRLQEALADLVAVFGGDRRAVICRELTKQHETSYAETLAGLHARAANDGDMSRGEIVIVVAGSQARQSAAEIDSERLLHALLEDLSPSQAAKVAARITGAKRSDLYDKAMRAKQSP